MTGSSALSGQGSGGSVIGADDADVVAIETPYDSWAERRRKAAPRHRMIHVTSSRTLANRPAHSSAPLRCASGRYVARSSNILTPARQGHRFNTPLARRRPPTATPRREHDFGVCNRRRSPNFYLSGNPPPGNERRLEVHQPIKC